MTPRQTAFILANLNTVPIAAAGFASSGVPRDELEGYGYVGLCKAALSFNPDLCAAGGWAMVKVKSAMRDGIRAWYGYTQEDGTKRLHAAPTHLPDDWDEPCADHAENACLHVDLAAAMRYLPDRIRSAIVAAASGRGAQVELARSLGVSEARITHYCRMARERLTPLLAA